MRTRQLAVGRFPRALQAQLRVMQDVQVKTMAAVHPLQVNEVSKASLESEGLLGRVVSRRVAHIAPKKGA